MSNSDIQELPFNSDAEHFYVGYKETWTDSYSDEEAILPEEH